MPKFIPRNKTRQQLYEFGKRHKIKGVTTRTKRDDLINIITQWQNTVRIKGQTKRKTRRRGVSLPDVIYRAGKPRVREAMDEFDKKRSTGLFASGLYSFRDKEVAVAFAKRQFTKTEIYQLPISNFRFYVPNNLDDFKDFCRALTYIAIDDNPKWTLDMFDFSAVLDLKRKVREEATIRRTKTFIRLDAYQNVQDNRDWAGINTTGIFLVNAIQKTKECIKKRPKLCSQPINHLLGAQGYDGIFPKGDASNDNRFGIVIFTEALEKKLGRRLQSFKNFQFGIKIA